MEEREDAAARRALGQQAALFALLKSGVPTAGTAVAWRAITEAAARTLGAARAAIWVLTPDRQALVAGDRFDVARGHLPPGDVLEASRFPSYFHALRWTRAIVAPDAVADERTAEVATGYAPAMDAASMLHAGIWHEGQARGAVCVESVGERRDWTADEQQFAASLADIAAMVLVYESLDAARARLQESQELLTSALRSSPDPMLVVRLTDHRILLVNERLKQVTGLDDAALLGRTPLELGLWADPAQRDRWVARLVSEGAVRDHEADLRLREGRVRHFLLSGETVEIHGAPCAVLAARDVTDRRRLEDLVAGIAEGVAAETGEAFFRSLVGQLSRVLGADVAFAGEIDPANPDSVRVIALAVDHEPAAAYTFALAGTPSEAVMAGSAGVVASGAAQRFPEDGELARLGVEAVVGAPLLDAQGRPLGVLSVLFRRPLEDAGIAENLIRIFAARASGELQRGQDLRELERAAHVDALTGLPNRLQLEKRLHTQLANGPGALVLIDLDRFREINDTLGHPVGDALLAALGRRLSQGLGLGEGGIVARLGGDEFAVWAPSTPHALGAAGVALRALACLTEPIDAGGYRLDLSASAGIALAPAHGNTAAALLRCADVAMYAAKARGSGYATYDASLDPYSTKRLVLLSELGAAVAGGQLRLHFQPRVDLRDGRVRVVEALVRWQHPREGLLPPGRFVPLAELSGAIRPVTSWVLETGLRQLREWLEAGHDVRLAVNLSARHLMDDGCPDFVEHVLNEAGVAAARLELEVTESAFIAEPERAGQTLARLRALGAAVAIDDFGTGFSSLAHLRRLPLSAIKIDLSFVRQMTERATDRAIVQSTIHLAHDLGHAVVAEGVEDAPTLEALRAMGCDEAQGHHIAAPMDAAAMGAWLAARRG